MQISVNGEIEEITLQAMAKCLETKGLTGCRIAVERNGNIVLKSQYNKVILGDGDTLEIVHAIGGG